jgi:thioredoxin reductase (NADPH)
MEQLFPTLTSAQMARIAARGRRRAIARGEVLVEAGDIDVPFFAVVGGEVQALRPAGATEILIVAHGPGTVHWRSHHDHRPPGDRQQPLL